MCWFRIRFCQFHLWSESMMASCFCNANEWWGHTGYDLEQASGRTLITWWNSLLICWSWIVCEGSIPVLGGYHFFMRTISSDSLKKTWEPTWFLKCIFRSFDTQMGIKMGITDCDTYWRLHAWNQQPEPWAGSHPKSDTLLNIGLYSLYLQ